MNTRLIFIHALSPLHAGTGQGVGVIDLPIAREKATGIPFLPGSSLKGTLRDAYLSKFAKNSPDWNKGCKVFGPETENADAYAGAAQFADQRLLLLPVRSLAGTFAWVTSPYLLQRFNRDAAFAGITKLEITQPADAGCWVVQPYPSGKETVKCQLYSHAGKVVLEDLDLTPKPNEHASAWAKAIGNYVFHGDATWQRMLAERLCIVSDDVLSFLLNTATEITARIKLQDDVKTVQKGGLWYEESLPTETIMYGLVVATPNNKTELAANGKSNEDVIFEIVQSSIPPSGPVQLGGKATVGRGLCRVLLHDSQAQAQATRESNAPPAKTPDSKAEPLPTPSTVAPGAKVKFGQAPVVKLHE